MECLANKTKHNFLRRTTLLQLSTLLVNKGELYFRERRIRAICAKCPCVTIYFEGA